MEPYIITFIDPDTGEIIPHLDYATNIIYDNTNTTLEATTVQDAITELYAKSDATSIVEITLGGSVSQSIQANTFYKFTQPLTVLQLTLLKDNIDSTLECYFGKFTTDSSGCEVTAAFEGSASLGTITLEGSTTYEFYVVDGMLSFTIVGDGNQAATTAVSVASISFQEGSYEDALAFAASHQSEKFQWLWIGHDDDNDVDFKKVIWHVGNCVFIDAFGGVVS